MKKDSTLALKIGFDKKDKKLKAFLSKNFGILVNRSL